MNTAEVAPTGAAPASPWADSIRPAPDRRVADFTPTIVVVSIVLVGVSTLLTLLSLFGLGGLVPMALRVPLVVLVAVTLPGLPVAALLRLPLNGVFASVAVALSISTTLLLPQLGLVAGVHQPFATQMVIIGIAAMATVCLARQGHRQPSGLGNQAGRSLLIAVGTALARSSRYSLALLAISVVLFFIGVSRLETDRSSAAGLIGILGVEYLAGLGVLCIVLATEYRRRCANRVMLALSNVVLIMYLTMPVAWSDRTAPFSTAYVHRYVTNWIFDIGALPPPVDARISWSGFFSAAAHLMTIGSLTDSEVFLTSASFFFGALLIFPVYALTLALSGNTRTAWLGVTVFILFNWYQQDYFAPQAVAMQLYATILAVLVWQWGATQQPAPLSSHHARMRSARSRLPGRVPGTDARWSLAVEAVLVVLVAAMVVSHQLTPLVTIGALLLLSVLGATRHKLLWVAALLIFVTWFTYGAGAFWQGHLGELLDELGSVGSSLDAGVSNRVAGDPIYGRMQMLRMGASALLLAMAAFGWYRIRRTKFRLVAPLLALAPFLLVLVQSYGGEVVIRCFLYASPILAPLAAIAFRSTIPLGARSLGTRPGLILLTGGLVLALAAWGVTNRGLNTSFERTDRYEATISEQLVRQADPGSIAYWGQGTLLGLPRGHEIGPTCIEAGRDLAECTAAEDAWYLIVTRQDKELLQYRYRVDHESAQRAIERLVADHGFEPVYRSELIQVLKRAGARPVNLGTQR